MAEEVIWEIQWTNSAKLTFNKIINYLRKEWTEKEVTKFVRKVDKTLSTLKRHPEMCRPSVKRKNVRIAILDKQTQIVYHYKPGNKKLVLLLFWNPKRNPSKFKF